jgi:hypothetical protein
MVDEGIANVGVPNGVIAHSGYFSEDNVQSVEELPPLLVARRGGREGRVPPGLRGPQSRQAQADRGADAVRRMPLQLSVRFTMLSPTPSST